MKVTSLTVLGAIAACAWAGTFEPGDFNATKALIGNGVDVSKIPGLTALVDRSSSSACSIAVCRRSSSSYQLATGKLTLFTV